MVQTKNTNETFFSKSKKQKTNTMKKIYSFLAMLFLVGMASPSVYGQASCPIILKNQLKNNGDGTYTYTIAWDNPTSGAKSINVKLGSCFNQCIDASVDGEQSFTFSCTTPPSIAIYRHTGNINCSGTFCGEVILPLDIIQFSANKQGQSVSLKWKAVKELIEAGESFGVERSTDARTFTNIGTVSASSQIGDYSFIDNPGTATRVFYRLALNNNAGGRKYSNIVSVALDVKGPKIEVPQNSGIVRLTMLGGAQASIIDMTGRSIQTFTVVGDFTSVQLKDFSPGTYMIRCVTRDGDVVTQKFIR